MYDLNYVYGCYESIVASALRTTLSRTAMMDTVEKIEEYWESFEEYFFSSLSSATADLPNVHEAFNKLWLDIARYGPAIPSFPAMHVPVLGDFHLPPPPPPPPPPPHLSWLSECAGWTRRHPWTTSGIVLGVVGASFMAGYRNAHTRRRNEQYRVKSQSHERRQVVGASNLILSCRYASLKVHDQSSWEVILPLPFLLSWISRQRGIL